MVEAPHGGPAEPDVTGNSFKANISTFAGLKQALYRMYNYCSGAPVVLPTSSSRIS
jgi:hypothetical protein